MSLPSGQQRVLDKIENQLRESEPRLAAMFALFTRLNLGEPWPGREELSLCCGLGKLTAGLRRGGRAPSRRGPRSRRRRHSGVLALIGCHVAAAVAILGLVISLSVRTAPSCPLGHRRGLAVTGSAVGRCRAQAGLFGYSVPLSK